MSDKKRVKKQEEKLTLKVLEERMIFLGKMLTELQEASIKDKLVSAPKNATAEAPAHPVVVEKIFRVITNGKKYQVECSSNDGLSWYPMFEANIMRDFGEGHCVVPIEKRSYRAAVKYIRKQYGEKAIILEREWRAV